MKNTLLKIFTIVLMAGVFHACNEPLVEEQDMDDVELKSAQTNKTSYIVVLNDSELNAELVNLKGYEMRQQAAQKAAEKVMKRAGIIDGEIELVYETALQGFSVKIPPGQLNKLQNDPAVISVTEDELVTLIKPGTDDVAATATQTTPWGITRVKAGTTYTGNNVAWIIDTGIDLDHPDLNVDAGSGKTFVTRTSTPDDDNGHGSHVAGTVAAIDNAEGVVGVAAGATLIPVKVLDRRGSGYMSWIIGGVNYVAANGKSGDVANMSLGGSYYKDLNDAVIAAASQGIKFSLAAGNESTSATTKSPASANGTNVYTVSAMDINDNFASFSNYGNPPVDYCEPGVSILSTYKGGAYATMSGTSMAAPHMAGLLLLGNTKTDGTVNNDPDGNADPILVYNGTVTPPPPPDNVAPTADFSWSASELTVNFTDASFDSDGNVVAWSWNFGDGGVSTAQNPEHSYAAAGTYGVTLTLTDDDGATGTVSKNVTVSSSSTNEAPVITSFSLVNTSNPAMKRVQVNWSVTDSDGDLKTVETQLTGPGTASAITNVSGSSASGIHELSIKKGSSGDYTVTIIVTDVAGNTTTDSQNITL